MLRLTSSLLMVATNVFGGELIEKTYLSPGVTLHPGQIANTDPTTFQELDWPKEPIAITYFNSEVVDEDGNAVPLYDLYIHHWLVYVNMGKFQMGWCEFYNTWGIGAEMRGTIYEYPYPYAVVFDGTETWEANLHFIRTDTVPQSDKQLCIECHCYDGTPAHPHGSISCCEDGTFCYGMPNSTVDPKTYYLQYTIKYYQDIPTNVKPLTMFAFDVTSQENFDCYVEYQISNTSVENGKVNFKQNSTIIPQDTDIVLIEIHQHIGGVNYTVDHYDSNGKYIGVLCESSPIYGNGTEVGNEDGYVVKIPTCEFPANNPYSVKKDDKLVLTSLYDGRHIKGGGEYHEGVMGILFYWGQRTGPSQCESVLKSLCGNPLPHNSNDCADCAKMFLGELAVANCGGNQYGWKIVDFLCLTDNGIKTSYNDSMVYDPTDYLYNQNPNANNQIKKDEPIWNVQEYKLNRIKMGEA